MQVTAPEGVSTCISKNAKGEWAEKVYDYVIACNSLKRKKISQMNVVEDFESRPHKAVSFVVERGKERQEWTRKTAEGVTWIQWRNCARKEHTRERRRRRRGKRG